jgi:hypothetical protein
MTDPGYTSTAAAERRATPTSSRVSMRSTEPTGRAGPTRERLARVARWRWACTLGSAVRLVAARPDAGLTDQRYPSAGRGERPHAGKTRLTPRARHVVDLARLEARWRDHAVVEPEHLLLGLIREGEGVAWGILESLGVQAARLRADVQRADPRTPAGVFWEALGSCLDHEDRARRIHPEPALQVREPVFGPVANDRGHVR